MSALLPISAVESVPIWPLTVEQYHIMIDQGILGPNDPVELLEGLLVRKMGKNPRHRIATDRAYQALSRSLPSGWYVSSQNPITLSTSEPEPDFAIIRGETEHYPDRHPGPSDVALVIEISDSSLDRDRILKKRIYASAGIPVYWIVDLEHRQVEVYTNPAGSDYSAMTVFGPDAAIPLPVEYGGEIPVARLLPGA